MGYYCHHTIVIVASGSEAARILDALNRIRIAECPDMPALQMSGRAINGFRTILVSADGSKEGWADSDLGEAAREQMKEYLNRSTACDWVELEMGDTSREIVDSDQHWMELGR